MKDRLFCILIALSCLAISACTAPSTTEAASMPANTSEQDAGVPAASPAPQAQSRATATPESDAGPVNAQSGSIAGAIRIGTRAAPAMRVCATAVTGDGHYCTTTAAGATQYRIGGVTAGRYHLIGWVRDGDMKLLAHADITRCIAPPCPPDTLRVVEVADGEAVTGIDLSAPYADTPEGWPGEPVGQ